MRPAARTGALDRSRGRQGEAGPREASRVVRTPGPAEPSRARWPVMQAAAPLLAHPLARSLAGRLLRAPLGQHTLLLFLKQEVHC